MQMYEYKDFEIRKIKNYYWIFDNKGDYIAKFKKLSSVQKYIDDKQKKPNPI